MRLLHRWRRVQTLCENSRQGSPLPEGRVYDYNSAETRCARRESGHRRASAVAAGFNRTDRRAVFAEWRSDQPKRETHRVLGRKDRLELERGYIRAELRVLGQPGRQSGVTNGSRWEWDLGNTSADGNFTTDGGEIALEDRDRLKPGETAVVRIHPVAPELWTLVHPGMVINAHQGPRIVAIARVLEVVGAPRLPLTPRIRPRNGSAS